MAVAAKIRIAARKNPSGPFFSIMVSCSMAYIICEPCVGVKDTACVDVCPVDCIHPRKDEPSYTSADMLYIHPDECIDCGACVPACPVEAIFALDETPNKWADFIEKNAQYYGDRG
jgi:NAD-dependent dihydropyrimidine dehydrogenase PreA subunit